MKLTFKDLKNQKFFIEAEPSETIADVKAKISTEKGWEASLLKLIYSGKILQDGSLVESHNFKQKDFIVCMVTKPNASMAASSKSVPQPSSASQGVKMPAVPSAPTTEPTTSRNPPETLSSVPAHIPALAPALAPTSTRSDPLPFNDPSALALGPEREAAITNMESMGFKRADIERAMRAAFFNPDRAIEYLLTGIPESAIQQQQQQQEELVAASPSPAPTGTAPMPSPEAVNLFEAAAQAGRGSGHDSGGPGGVTAAPTSTAAAAAATTAFGAGSTETGGRGASGRADNPLEYLRNNPQFQQMRQILQVQPDMLDVILQQIGGGNPALAQLISDHPEDFLRLLSQEVGDEEGLMPTAHTISVTEEERDTIDRICRLGFDRELVIQAYFACEKNEEMTLNFLLDRD